MIGMSIGFYPAREKGCSMFNEVLEAIYINGSIRKWRRASLLQPAGLSAGAMVLPFAQPLSGVAELQKSCQRPGGYL